MVIVMHRYYHEKKIEQNRIGGKHGTWGQVRRPTRFHLQLRDNVPVPLSLVAQPLFFRDTSDCKIPTIAAANNSY
jgi:hypothetical protein